MTKRARRSDQNSEVRPGAVEALARSWKEDPDVQQHRDGKCTAVTMVTIIDIPGIPGTVSPERKVTYV
jgi:hypothetical protein